MEEIIHRNINDKSDSIEIGTPAKGGCIKIYGEFNKSEEFKEKINQAFEIRQHAKEKWEEQENVKWLQI